MRVKTENHILSISFMINLRMNMHVHSKILAVRFVSYLVSNTIQGLKGRWGEVTSHPIKLKPTTISGGNDSDLPK